MFLGTQMQHYKIKQTASSVTCSCGCCSVDGGLDYLRRCFKNSQEEDFIDLSRTIEIDE